MFHVVVSCHFSITEKYNFYLWRKLANYVLPALAKFFLILLAFLLKAVDAETGHEKKKQNL